jgi:ABC-type Na+ efflux pump permease subunit
MKLFKVARREYLDRVRRKSFVIGTILGPLLMGGMIVVPGLLFEHSPESRMSMAVIDLTKLAQETREIQQRVIRDLSALEFRSAGFMGHVQIRAGRRVSWAA